MTPLALAAWALSAILLFLPVGRVARLARRWRSPGGPESVDALPPPPDARGDAPGEDALAAGSSAGPAQVPEADDASGRQARSPATPAYVGALRWAALLAIYAVFVVTSVYLTPRLLARVLDSEHPMAAVTSQSMYPALKKGDLVFIEGVDDVSDLKVGDIVAFEHLTGFAIHRVEEIDGEKITTKGDANRKVDPEITFDQVVGRALTVNGRLAKIPYLGNIPLVVGRASEVDAAEADPLPD